MSLTFDKSTSNKNQEQKEKHYLEDNAHIKHQQVNITYCQVLLRKPVHAIQYMPGSSTTEVTPGGWLYENKG